MTDVSAVFERFPHHSAYSGYPRFLDRLGLFTAARRARRSRLPRAALERQSQKVIYDWYDAERLRTDLTATRRLAIARGEVVHLLYGETDHFYAGRMRAFGRRRGNRLVATFHQPPSLLDQLLPAPPLFEQLDHAIALGPRAAAHLETVVNVPVSYASHGIDTDAWRPGAAEADEPTCAFVGSWFRDFDTLAEVIGAVRAAEPRVRFELVTEQARAERFAALPGVRVRNGITDAELLATYQRAWLCVLPLTDAVANNALLEGMACGVATVTSDVGDVPHYAGDGARLVPRADVEAMAAAVLELLEDRAAREQLGRLARQQAERHSLTTAAREHAQAYAAAMRD